MEMESRQQQLKYSFSFHLLPTEIAADILCRLPNVDSILRCKLVCKNWYALINNPVFFDTHTHRFLKELYDHDHQYHYLTNSFILAYPDFNYFHYGDYHADNIDMYIPNRFKVYKKRDIIAIGLFTSIEPWIYMKIFMAGLCNGLVCLCSNRHFTSGPGHARTYRGWFYVSNPVTREYLDIPIPEYTFYGISFESFSIATGFGYCTSTKEFKIVRVAYINDDVKGSMVHVYTLGSGKWRSKGEINHLLGEINHSLGKNQMCGYERNSIGICLNGALYWMNEKMEIILFDLADEEFRIVPVTRPSCFKESASDIILLGGCLCLTQHNYYTCMVRIWVILMNKEEYSLIEKFNIKWESESYLYNIFNALIPFALLSNGNILFHTKACTYIVSYDPKTERFSRQNEVFVGRVCKRIFPYMKSFVSLKALQEKYAMARKLKADRGIGNECTEVLCH